MPRNTDFDENERKIAVLDLLKAEVLPLNKAALFEALQSTGICSIVVCFDGSGDSGQMEEIVAFIDDSPAVDLPDITVKYRDATFSCELLEKTHGGWANGDGAEAAFTFKVADRSITLDYHERYISTDYSRHVF